MYAVNAARSTPAPATDESSLALPRRAALGAIFMLCGLAAQPGDALAYVPYPKEFGSDGRRNGPGSARSSALEILLPEQAASRIASGALLIDVRTTAEFAQGHVPGAINVPVFLKVLLYRYI